MGVGFTNLKMDEYEKNQCEKGAIFGTLQNDLRSVSMKIEDLKKQKGRQKQCSRRNCILIY